MSNKAKSKSMPKKQRNELYQYYHGLQREDKRNFRNTIFNIIAQEAYKLREFKDFTNWLYGYSEPEPIEKLIINRVAGKKIYTVYRPKTIFEEVETATAIPVAEHRGQGKVVMEKVH